MTGPGAAVCGKARGQELPDSCHRRAEACFTFDWAWLAITGSPVTCAIVFNSSELVAVGEHVVDVPSTLSARAWFLVTGGEPQDLRGRRWRTVVSAPELRMRLSGDDERGRRMRRDLAERGEDFPGLPPGEGALGRAVSRQLPTPRGSGFLSWQAALANSAAGYARIVVLDHFQCQGHGQPLQPRSRTASRGEEDSPTEQIPTGAAEHLPLQHLDLVVGAFGGAGTVAEAKAAPPPRS